MTFKIASEDVSDFLFSAALFSEPAGHVAPESGDGWEVPYQWGDRIPLPSPSDPIKRMHSELVVFNALDVAARRQDIRDFDKDTVDRAWLTSYLERIRRLVEMAEESDLGGVPQYRPLGYKGEQLPLYDYTNEGNLNQLRSISGIGMLEKPIGGITAEQSRILKEAMQSDNRIVITEDANSALRAALALYGVDIEASVQATKSPPPPPSRSSSLVPPGHVLFTLETNHSGINVDYWPHAIRQADTRMAKKTDFGMKTSDTLRCGTYGFSTPDLNKPTGIDDHGSHGVWTHSPSSSTSDF